MYVGKIQPPLSDRRTGNATSARLLLELRDAHENLFAAMAVMDGMARDVRPERSTYANVRWRVSRASLTRRTLWGTILRHLLPIVSAKEVADLDQLKAADQQMLHLSAKHITIWTLDQIEADWKGYCAASVALRGRMKTCLGAKQRILYPMLERNSLSGTPA